jgi:hypothetical protein
MKLLLSLLLLSSAACAQHKPALRPVPLAAPGTTEARIPSDAMQAEIESLKAQLAEMQLIFQYEQQICQAPDVIQARLARMQAAQKAQAAKAPTK